MTHVRALLCVFGAQPTAAHVLCPPAATCIPHVLGTLQL